MTRAIERRLVDGIWVTGDFEEGGSGGSQPFTTPLIVQPDASSVLGTDPDHLLEQPSPVLFVAPATYAMSYFFFSGQFVAVAVEAGVAGNAISVVLADGGDSVVVGVVGTTITFTFPFGPTTCAEIVDAWNASTEALALAVPTLLADGLVDQLGTFAFGSGYEAGQLVRFRLANRATWYVRADGGVDIESATGEFIGQIDLQGAYFRAQPGGDALTAVDSDYNNLIQANASGLGFNGAAPSIPEIPATPDAQAVADVLVALGLVTQAAP